MMMDTEQPLPQGWVECTLGDIGDWGSGGTPSRSNASFFQGNIPWIKTGELGDKYVRCAEEKITEEAVKKSSAKIFPKESVGIAMYGATIGKVSIWGIEASTNQACAVVNAHDAVFNEYVYYYLLSEKRGFINAGKGGAQPNISQTLLKSWCFPLPPLNEQKRIVAKIEALFSEIDKGTEELKTAQAKAKQYRQALLKHAFSGKLTADWRAEHGVLGEDNGLPLGWLEKSLGRLGYCHGGGTPSKSNPEFWENGDILWITPKDMKSQKITDSLLKITERGLDDSSAKLTSNKALLFVLRSGILRRILPIAIVDKPVTINQDLLALNLDETTDICYLYWYCVFSEKHIRETCAKDGTTVESVDSFHLKSYNVILPPLPEQEEIVRRLEAQFSVLDALEADLATNLKKAETLKQAILKKAFAGKLLPQDPTDEPASELLKRIQAEKATQAKAPKTPRKKKATTA